MDKKEVINDFTEAFNLASEYTNPTLDRLAEADSRYLRDLKMNVKNTLRSNYLNEKETALIALSIASNQNNSVLEDYSVALAMENGATKEDIAEAIACASLLSNNNVLYRFRHFTKKEEYQQLPAKMRMNIMMNPVLGKEFFELLSLSVSAVNACELCISSHEKSLIELGCSEEKIFDAIRLSAVIVSLSKILY